MRAFIAICVLLGLGLAFAQNVGESEIAESDVVVLVNGLGVDDVEIRSVLAPRLVENVGVSDVEIKGFDADSTAILLEVEEEHLSAVVAWLEQEPERMLRDAEILIGGSAVADAELELAINRALVAAAAVGLAALGLFLKFSTKLSVAVSVVAVNALAVFAGAFFAAKFAENFDGSLASTALPGFLFAGVSSVVLTTRYLEFFATAQVHDRGESVRKSVRSVGAEMLVPLITIAGLGVVSDVLVPQIVGPTRSLVVVALAGAVVAGVLVSVLLPALLVSTSTGRRQTVFEGYGVSFVWLCFFACLLTGFALFGVYRPSGDLLDVSALPEDSAPSLVASEFDRLAGDDRRVDANGVAIELRAESDSGDAAEVWQLWVLIVFFVGAAGSAVLYHTRSRSLAGLAGGLRLVETLALLGLCRVVADGATGVELQLIVLVANLGLGLYELRVLRTVADSSAEGAVGLPDVDKILVPGIAVSWFVASMVFGLAMLFSSLVVLQRFGWLLVVAAAFELVVGLWILRPAIYKERLRWIVQSSCVGSEPDSAAEAIDCTENRGYTKVVNGLLRSEHASLVEPGSVDLSNVFVAGSQLCENISKQHESMQKSGLRIVGQGPVLKHLEVVDAGTPVIVSIVVEYPVRRIAGRSGELSDLKQPEKHEGMLWLSQDASGRYRIAEALAVGGSLEDDSDVQLGGLYGNSRVGS